MTPGKELSEKSRRELEELRASVSLPKGLTSRKRTQKAGSVASEEAGHFVTQQTDAERESKRADDEDWIVWRYNRERRR